MKRIILLCALMVMWVLPALSQDVITITVEGSGVSKDAALQDAKRIAVEKGIGQIVAGETIVKNYDLFSDQIISRSNGFVKTYDELEARQEADGTWYVKIEARVTEILDQVLKDQMAIDLLLGWVKKPRFMIVIDEDNVGDTNSGVAEIEIGKRMSGKNFDVVSRDQIAAIHKRSATIQSIAGSEDVAMSIASEFGAEIIVIGNARAVTTDLSATGYSNLGMSGMKSGQASISAKVIRTDTGNILAQNTFTGAFPHINPTIAGTKALQKAGAALADYLIAETIRTWSQEQSNFRTFLIRINGVTYSTAKSLEYILEETDGVRQVRRKGFNRGTVEFQVDFTKGSIDDLAGILDGYSEEDFVLVVVGATDYSLDINLQNP